MACLNQESYKLYGKRFKTPSKRHFDAAKKSLE